ncbi:MAG: minor capsid protein [Oscillospiraceae bacterium]|nr:minor capsid protein [Oscillospiraceae bacterium]
MNNTKHQLMVKQTVKGRFHGHESLKGKTTPQYPDSAEREFKRICNGYMRLLNQTLQENLPELMEAYKAHQRGDSRFDDIRDIEDKARSVFQKIFKDLEQKLARYGLDDMVRKIARMTKNTTLREWKRSVKETLGVDLFSDYYNGAFYEHAIRRWVDENVLKIRSIPNETLGEMQQIVLNGYRRGASITQITKEIQEQYKLSRRKAQLLARDQVSTLNAQITKMQQEDAGCKKYRWSTSKDSRVRPCHKALDGKVISWDDPPEMWYDTKGRGRVYTGRRCHPGEDYCCRCVAIPEFNIDTVDVPMKDSKPKE